MKKETAYIYEFDSFRLDPERKCLWHSDTLVTLTPKAVETLLVLVRNAGEVVEKRELLDEVWENTFVEESTLSQNILTLRKTLAAFEADKNFIATVPRRGFRFVAPVRKLNGKNGSSNGNGASEAMTALEPAALPDHDHSVKPEASAASRKSAHFMTGLAIVAVIAGIIGFAWYLSRSTPMVDAKFREFRITSLLSDSNIRSATISPDGKYLSLIEKRGDTERLLVRQVGESTSIEVVPPTAARLLGDSFSPDSQYVFYTAYRDDANGVRVGELFRVPLLGGPTQMLLGNVDSPVSISRSGKLSFVRRRQAEGSTEVIVADLDGKNERTVSTRKLDEGFLNAAISPDGRSIVSAANSKASLTRPMELVLIDAATGNARPLTEQSWLWIGQSAWLADGSGVAVVGYGAMSPNLTDEIWFVSVPDGKARMLESGVNGVFGVSLTADGNSIAAVKSDKIANFVVSPIDDLSKEETIVTKAGDQSLLQLGADWASDGRILFSTTDNGNADIWSLDAGGDRKRITADKYADLQPQASPDGQHLYFLSNRSGRMSVWRSKMDGTEAQKLTDGSDVFSINLSPDGRSIYYTSRADSLFSQHLWRAAADGAGATKLASTTTHQPRISPDGKTIACYQPPTQGGPSILTLLNTENGEVIRQFPERKNDFLHEWLPNGRELIVLSRKGAGTALGKLSVETGEAIQLKEWPNENVFRLALSPNGERLFYEKGVSVNNVLLLQNTDGN